MTNIAVILAGSGAKDGSEIHEATLTLYFLDLLNAHVQCYAPNRPQLHVVNHVNDATSDQPPRHILEESARIARGNVKPIDEIDLSQYDAIIFPGGFGAAKNLCDYALKGADCSVQDDVARVVTAAHAAGKVLGFICIAPVIAAKLIPGVTVTVGQPCDTASHIESWGATHQTATVNESVWDAANRVASTPAYMLGPSIKDVASGIESLCKTVVEKSQQSDQPA